MWSGYFKDLGPEDMVKLFATKGWRDLELSTEHSDMLMCRGEMAAVGREFRSFIQSQDVRISQGHLWLTADLAGPEQAATIDTLKRWLDLYHAIGITAAVLHPGGHKMRKAGAADSAIRDAQVRGLSMLCDHIAGSAIRICLENGKSAEPLCELIQAVGSGQLGICLDTGHLNIGQPGDQLEFIRRAGGLLKALHIADNDGSSDQHLMPYGRGTVNWRDVVSGLNEIGYSGLFNFEIPGENKCPMPARLAKLDYLKQIVPLLLSGATDEELQ